MRPKLVKSSLLLALSLALSACLCHGNDWYVAPSGAGIGTLASPWSLTTAATNSAITGGDTVWLRAGTYDRGSNGYTVTISGSASNAPIIFRNYNRERATVNATLQLGTVSNVWWWGVEFIDTYKSLTNGDGMAIHAMIAGGGPGTKVINCLIHDCRTGIASYGAGVREMYGNVIWNAGVDNFDHGMYVHSGVSAEAAGKLIENNLVSVSSGQGMNIYGTSGIIKDITVRSNATWGNGMLRDWQSAYQMGSSDNATTNLIFQGNHAYAWVRGIWLGYGQPNWSAVVADNYAVAPIAIYLTSVWDDLLTLTNNVLLADGSWPLYMLQASIGDNSHYEWDHNRYWNNRAQWQTDFARKETLTNLTFAQWQTEIGGEANSTYASTTNSAPPSQVTVIPNRYETKRAHVVVWDWTGAHNVSVDVSGVLTSGDSYEVRSGFNYFGDPLASGTYSGGSITLPLTNLVPATALYWEPPRPVYLTPTNFAMFVVNAVATPSIMNATIGTAYFH